MAETGVSQTEHAGQVSHGADQESAETVSKAEYDKLLAQSRKWEQRSKDNAAKAKELDELKAASLTDAEKLADATKRAEAAEAKVKAYEAKAERAAVVAEVAAAKGVDADLLGRMAGSTREEVEADADFIADRMKGARIYPNVPDAGQRRPQPVTKADIEAIKDPKERVRMRAKHIDLYR